MSPGEIDEAFLDVSSRVRDFEDAKKLGSQIKKGIYEKEQSTCSIGIGPNTLIAKVASDLQKPDGLTVVEQKDMKAFLEPLDVDKLLWPGKKTTRKLNAMRIKTIGDLAVILQFLPRNLVSWYAQGIDPSEVGLRGGVKSVSRKVTFEKDTSEWDFVFKILDKLCEECTKK